jgi:hypothetical protein
MSKKSPSLIENSVDGIDLLVERDSGNEVRILTGSLKYSLDFWYKMQELSEQAISELSIKRERINMKIRESR